MTTIENSKRLSDIKKTFQLFSDPLDIISYLIDIGKKSHNIIDEEKTDFNIISGCTSRAWIIVSRIADDKYYIKTDSDSHIVSGLLYLLCLYINNQSKDFINAINGIDILKFIGLDGNITSQRTNGFLSAIQTLKERIN